jgi:hypothetical protein
VRHGDHRRPLSAHNDRPQPLGGIVDASLLETALESGNPHIAASLNEGRIPAL